MTEKAQKAALLRLMLMDNATIYGLCLQLDAARQARLRLRRR